MSLVHSIKTGSDGVKSVKWVQFGVLSPKRILEESVADIHKHMTRGGELQGTLQDQRLGATRTTRNSITNLDSKLDPGLFGHCVLTLPVYHPIFIKQVHGILRVVCPGCSSLRETDKVDTPQLQADIKSQRIPKTARLAYIHDKLSKRKEKQCVYCKTDLPDIVADKTQILGFAFAYVDINKQKVKISQHAKTIFDILKKISDPDAELMGFDPKYSRPEWMIYTILPVPPPTMRPSVEADNNKTSDDDITQSLHNIIKTNNTLKDCLEETGSSDELDILEHPTVVQEWAQLQSQVAALVDNETSSYAKIVNRAQRPLKTIKGRHKGKSGRLRNNLMGKRTNYSARTVITADPNLSVDQVGVPYSMALILTYPEEVNQYNIETLTTLVRRGPSVYPGAKSIKKPGQTFTIELDCIKDRETILLEYGTIVYRHLIDGDIVLFNRQPSLHKMNMMAHYVKVLPGRSFRISANITQPYGADFDGDEMNLHLPQSEIARREIEMLALSPTQMCSPQSNAPVVGAVQDTMLATYRASSEHIRGYQVGEVYNTNIREFMNLSFWITNTPNLLPPIRGKGWTMQDLINLILPPITLTRKDKKNPRNKIMIKNGKLSLPESNDGKIVAMAKSNSMLGASSGSIFHITWNDLGPTASKDLMDDLSRVMSQWLMNSGFSVGLRDLSIPRVYMDEINQYKIEYMEKAYQLIDGLNNGNYTDQFRESLGLGQRGLTSSDVEQFEQDMIVLLDTCRNLVQESVADHIYEYDVGKIYDNRFMSMLDSGSKGKPTNAVQIVGTLGQQSMDGHRVVDAYYRRPLPFVAKDDLSPEGRGFVLSSYNSGLNFLEYIYHAMAGRMGVISTSIKTADTGYLQRKLMKRLEDIGTYYDGTVRLAGGAIVQYIYGGDGFDGSKVEKQDIVHIGFSVDELKLHYGFSPAEWDHYIKFLPESMRETFEDEEWLKEQQAAVRLEVDAITADWNYLRSRYKYNLPDSVPSIVNFDRLIDSLLERMGSAGSLPYLTSDKVLTPKYVKEKMDELVSTKLHLPTNDHINEHCMKQFVALIRSRISSKIIIMKKGYNKDAFDELLEEIHYKFYTGIITPGEAVGAIAAQSIGEPGTQMTLDAFHSTGAKITVSGGVPRFKEILSLTKMKTPSVSIYLQGVALPDSIKKVTEGAQTITEVDQYLLKLSETGDEGHEKAKRLKKEFVRGYLNGNEQSVINLQGNFKYIKFQDMVTRSEIMYIPNAESDPDKDVVGYNDEICVDVDKTEYPLWLIRFTLDRDVLLGTKDDVEEFASQPFGSDPVMKLTTCLEGEELILRATLNRDSGNINILNQKEADLMSTRIRGITDIIQTTVRKERKDIRFGGKFGKVVRRSDPDYGRLSEIMMSADDYIIDTVGSNLTDILGMENVDPYRTYTNDINEMQKTFGIEMGRKSIIRETREVLVNSAKTDIDVRHLGILADAMTCRGFMQKIDRNGAKKGESGPLALASFEETTTILCKAAANSEEDTMSGVSSNIMFGQPIKLGTNSFDVYLDEAMILEHGQKPKRESTLPIELNVGDIEACNDENMRFDFTLV
jgi:DNA-directed RNA polymerase II subunit RPB1